MDIGSLSLGEARVVRLVAEGYSDEEIAGRLSIAVSDVSADMAAVVRKLGLRSRTELALLMVDGQPVRPPVLPPEPKEDGR